MRKYHYLFYIILFSEKNTFLFKNRRQLKHKGNHFRAIGEGIKSFYLYMRENNETQMYHVLGQNDNSICSELGFGTERRTVLSWFWYENCIECRSLSKTSLHACKLHFIITNDVPNTHVRFLSIVHRLESVYGTVGPRSHPVRDTLLFLRIKSKSPGIV